MHPPYFPVPRPLNPHWLTAILQEAGVLPSGVVAMVETITSAAFNSRTEFLSLSYSAEAPLTAPRRLVLKCNTPEDWSVAAGICEVRFYLLAAQMAGHPRVIPPCWAADYDRSGGESFLLLEDLSETHAPPITRDQQVSIVQGVPPQINQEAVIDTLAALHAFWWDHPRLRNAEFDDGYWSRDPERFRQYLAKRSAAWERIVEMQGDRLPKEIHAFYERLFERLPDYYAGSLGPRFMSSHNLTLIHGDSYFCNFLCPKVPGSAPTYLMDWQSPSVDLGAYDLVNLLSSYWTRAQRREEDREAALLRRYHQSLLAHGVRGYDWEALVADYRAGIIFWVLMPIQDGGDGADWDYWRPKMQCLLDAFEDWDCWKAISSTP